MFLFVFNFYKNETTKSKHYFSASGAHQGAAHASSVTIYQSPNDAVPIGPKPPNC